MELKEAKEVINQAINAAVLKGCYNLEDIKLIVVAIEKLNDQPEVEFNPVNQ